ncbi:MAG: cytochrome c [Gemmata sp.]
MLRLMTKVALAGVFAVCAVMCAQIESAKAQDKKTSKQIMAAGHKGADALFGKVQAAVKAGKLEDAAAPAKELAANGALLSKATPPKGDAKSWEDLAGKYAANTKALSEAVEKKDADATKKAAGAIQGSCKACHDGHRGK